MLSPAHRDACGTVQEVPKGTDRTAQKCWYFWTCDLHRVVTMLIDQCYKTQANLESRATAERAKYTVLKKSVPGAPNRHLHYIGFVLIGPGLYPLPITGRQMRKESTWNLWRTQTVHDWQQTKARCGYMGGVEISVCVHGAQSGLVGDTVVQNGGQAQQT